MGLEDIFADIFTNKEGRMAKNHDKKSRRRDDGGLDKPEVVAVATASQPQQHTPILVTKDPELAGLLRQACLIALEQGDSYELPQELRDRAEALRVKVRELDRQKNQAFMRWLQSTGLDQGLVLPDKSGQARNVAQGVMWVLFPWNARFFSAWIRLLTFTNRYDLKRPNLDNRMGVVVAANEALKEIPVEPAVKSLDDLQREDFMDLLSQQTKAARKYDGVTADIAIVQESVDKMIAAHQRRQAGEEVDEEAQAAFATAEEPEPVSTPESLREQANKLQAEAKKVAEAGDYEVAALRQKEAKRLLVEADDLEKSLAEAERAARIAEAAETPLVSTTNVESIPLAPLAEAAKVTKVPVETPESLEAEAIKLQGEIATLVAAQKFEAAASNRDRIKALLARAAEMRAEAKRRAAAEAAAAAAKPAVPVAPPLAPVTAPAPTPTPTPAAPATEAAAPKKTKAQALKELQQSFYEGKITPEQFCAAVTALG